MRSMIIEYGGVSSIAVPPSETNSARTPASRRSGLGSGRPPAPSAERRAPGRSIRSVYVSRQHRLPVRPVVGPAVPDPQGVPEPLRPEPSGEPLVVAAHRVVAAD